MRASSPAGRRSAAFQSAFFLLSVGCAPLTIVSIRLLSARACVCGSCTIIVDGETRYVSASERTAARSRHQQLQASKRALARAVARARALATVKYARGDGGDGGDDDGDDDDDGSSSSGVDRK